MAKKKEELEPKKEIEQKLEENKKDTKRKIELIDKGIKQLENKLNKNN